MADTLKTTVTLKDNASNTLVRLIGQTTRLINNFENLNRAMRGGEQIRRNFGAVGNEVQTSNNRVMHLSRSLAQTNTRVADLRRSYQNANQRIVEMQESLAQAARREAELVDRVRGLETRLQGASTAQQGFNMNINKGNNAMGRLLNTVRAVATTYISALSAKKFIESTDEYTNIKARLSLINDGLRTQRELQNEVFQAAQRSRGEYTAMSSTIAKLGLLAGNKFKNNDELIYFTETLQKAFKVSGASTQESSNAMYQLTQAMASGRLQGDEFRSIIENAPMLANAIAEYTGVGQEGLKNLSSQGAISADIIKNSLFMAADEINEKFNTMPMTFGDVWNKISGVGTLAFAPLFEKVNGILNDVFGTDALQKIGGFFSDISARAGQFIDRIQNSIQNASPMFDTFKSIFSDISKSVGGFMNNLFNAFNRLARNSSLHRTLTSLGKIVSWVIGGIGSLINSVGLLSARYSSFIPTVATLTLAFVAFKATSGLIVPIAQTIGSLLYVMQNRTALLASSTNTATIAQQGFNVALKSNPYMLIASAIGVVITAIGSLIASMQLLNKAAGLTSGLNSGEYSIEAWALHNTNGYSLPIAQQLVDNKKQRDDFEKETRNMITQKEGQIKKATEGAFALAKSDMEYQQRAGALPNQSLNASEMIKKANRLSQEKKELEESLVNNLRNATNTTDGLIQMDIQNKNADAEFKKIMNGVEGVNGYGDNGALDSIKDDTSKIADSIEISTDYLELMKEVAEREAINKFTTVPLYLDARSTNSINSSMDLDSVVTYILGSLEDGINVAAEGVHF